MQAESITSPHSTESFPAAGASNGFQALLSRFEPSTYALLRIVVGTLFACHGAQKVLGLLGGTSVPVGSQLWLGGLIEISTGLLIAVGVFTRAAAFLASGTMAVAYLQFHWQFSFAGGKWLPIVNQGELAVVYCFALLYIATRGGGAASIDSRRAMR
jgi:putative oxidoreductase